jgi:hypothetical protein
MASGSFFKKFRIAILLLILVVVGLNSWLTKIRSTDWDRELWVIVYPINGDDSVVSAGYIRDLRQDVFSPIEAFMQREGRSYHIPVSTPFTIKLAHELSQRPPPRPHSNNVLDTIWWSLKTRYWTWKVNDFKGPANDIQLFVLYFDPAQHEVLDHSIGLQKGMIGIVNAYASGQLEAKNNVVIAHEMLHTLGATDKYNFATNQPQWPEGYAAPKQRPLYPQTRAEIMAGRVPLTETKAAMPKSLYYTVIGEQTAREINWLQ